MQSRPEYSVKTNQTLHNFLSTVQRFSDEFQLPSRYLNCVKNVYQLQQDTSEVCYEMTGMPYL